MKVTPKANWQKKFLKSAPVRAEIRARAESIADHARASAPVDTGEYRESIEVVDDTTDRAVARVMVGTDHWGVIEHDHSVMGNALDSGAT